MITVIDTVTPGALAGMPYSDAFAGYVGGHFADLPTIEKDYPHHYFVSIAVHPDERAEFADFENGDFQNVGDLIKWHKRMTEDGIWRPGTYANASTLITLLPELLHHIPRQAQRVWGALWDGKRDIPAGWDGKQYSSETNPNVDLSVFRDNALPDHARPKPIPHTTRVWRNPVRATVTFDPATGGWDVHGGR